MTDPGPAPALPARPLPLTAGPSWLGMGAGCCWAGRPAEAQGSHLVLYTLGRVLTTKEGLHV